MNTKTCIISKLHHWSKDLFLRSLFFFIAVPSLMAASSPYVLFHPFDKTLEKIGSYIMDPEYTHIDIAMYSFEVEEDNPIISAFLNPETQSRIRTGQLKPRMIFQGYGTALATKISVKLEEMGIQVRWLKSTREVHHKFGVLYSQDFTQHVVITGSANWNRGSEANYDENILFIEDNTHVTSSFYQEFDLLWRNCIDFESDFDSSELPFTLNAFLDNYADPNHAMPIEVYFNSDNFTFTDGHVRERPASEGYRLTKEIVHTIDDAKEEILIATTRIRSLPIYNALMRAHKRGIKINIISNQTEYPSIYSSARKELPSCEDEFDKECSTSVNHLFFLDKETKDDPEPIAVRIKYFLSKSDSANLIHQMHHKYFIVDRSVVYTGTFNWSYSAEYGYMENIVRLDGEEYPSLIKRYIANFNKIWKQGRDQLDELKTLLKTEKELFCNFRPISMTFSEIDNIFYITQKKYLGAICL